MFKALGKLSLLAVLTLIGVVGLKFFNYQTAKDQRIEALEAKATQLKDVIDRLETERRVADIVVSDQVRQADGKLRTTLLMVEYDRSDRALPPRSFVVVGERVHLDALVIKFEAAAVQKADALRGHALLLFEKIYGDAQAPADATPVDPPEAIPGAYRDVDPKVSAFERDLWKQFWQLCVDPALREKYGVRVVHGVGVFEPLKPGNRYTVTLQADGNVTLHNEPLPEILTRAMKRGAGH